MHSDSGGRGVALMVGLIIGILISASFGPSEDDLELAMGQCEVVRDDYGSELERAYDNISYGNDMIYDAQSYAWSLYEDMSNSLENLEGVELLDDPGIE